MSLDIDELKWDVIRKWFSEITLQCKWIRYYIYVRHEYIYEDIALKIRVIHANETNLFTSINKQTFLYHINVIY